VTGATASEGILVKGKGSPYSITERRVPGLIPVLGSQPTGDVSHKPGDRLPLLFARPAVTLASLKRAATNFAAWWTEARWMWTVCLRLLPDSDPTKWLIVSYAAFALDFCPQRCRTRWISIITFYYGQKLLLIVVMLIGRLIWVYYQQISNFCRPALTYWHTNAISECLTADHVRHFVATFFSLLQQLCTLIMIFLYGWCEHLFVNELPDKYFKTVFFSG